MKGEKARSVCRGLSLRLMGAGHQSLTASPDKSHVRHFRALKKLNLPIGPGGVICLVAQSLPRADSALSIPVSAL